MICKAEVNDSTIDKAINRSSCSIYRRSFIRKRRRLLQFQPSAPDKMEIERASGARRRRAGLYYESGNRKPRSPVPENLTTVLRSQGSVRAFFAPPHLFSAICLNVHFSEKNGGKNNPGQRRKRNVFHPPPTGRREQTRPLGGEDQRLSPLDR